MEGIDLHTHSNISDGTLSPEQLVLAARAQNIHTLALTDHDSLDGVFLAEKIAEKHGINFISGVEISSQWSRPTTHKSYAVHIVALNIQNFAPLQAALAQQKYIRAQRAQKICDLLTPLIGENIYPDVLAMVDHVADRVTRTHIAKVLLYKKHVNRVQQAFDKYIKEGKKAYVKFDGLSLGETIQIIHQSGGYAILAHPTRYQLSATNIRYLIEIFARYGGDAVELPPASDPASTRQMIDRMIAEYQLKVSIGSDFHGDHMPWIRLGQTPRLTEGQVGIWESFD